MRPSLLGLLHLHCESKKWNFCPYLYQRVGCIWAWLTNICCMPTDTYRDHATGYTKCLNSRSAFSLNACATQISQMSSRALRTTSQTINAAALKQAMHEMNSNAQENDSRLLFGSFPNTQKSLHCSRNALSANTAIVVIRNTPKHASSLSHGAQVSHKHAEGQTALR